MVGAPRTRADGDRDLRHHHRGQGSSPSRTGPGSARSTSSACENFVKIFQTPELVGSLWNTLLLAFGFLIFTNILGLLFALALNRTLKTRYVLRTLIFMPVVVSPIAVSYIWKFIFDYNGPLNQALVARRPPRSRTGSPTRRSPSGACSS